MLLGAQFSGGITLLSAYAHKTTTSTPIRSQENQEEDRRLRQVQELRQQFAT